jgi:phosphomannomutase
VSDGLKFGTSGLRGPADLLVGAQAQRYVAAFIAHLRGIGRIGSGQVFIARDLRDSSPRIAADVAAAIHAAGLVPVDCGVLPTPALALHAISREAPSIMVTGSHIPGDRNGLKFYTPRGEITKADETGILAALPPEKPALAHVRAADAFAFAGDRYRQRYRGLLPPGSLNGWRLGVFEHSSVARDLLVSLLTRAGAEVIRLGRADRFVAVDTEAMQDPLFAARMRWIEAYKLHGIVSTDGDADRPLVIDETGEFVRGDALGVLTARFVGAQSLVTPVTSNSAIESKAGVRNVRRTRVGSPYVIAAMEGARTAGEGMVLGFEANGGVLLGSSVTVNDVPLAALPTRDAVLPILATLGLAARAGISLSRLVDGLGLKHALSDRLQDVPVSLTSAFVLRLTKDTSYAAAFFANAGKPIGLSSIDGPRFRLAGGDIVHYRPSGNAPELRCYIEAQTAERAHALLEWGLAAAAHAVREIATAAPSA